MVKAILFESNSGFTKRYANMMAELTGLVAYEINDAAKVLHEGDEIVFMGWIRAGMVNGYKKVSKWYKIPVVCGVGVGGPDTETEKKMTMQNQIPESSRLFLLQGGLDMNKLHGMDKFMMKTMHKALASQVEAKPEKTPYDENSIKMLLEGGDCVSEDNLSPVLNYLGDHSLI